MLFNIGNYSFGELSVIARYIIPENEPNELLQEHSVKLKGSSTNERVVMIEFNISKIIHRKTSKNELDPAVQFKILNDYINYRGPEFKKNLVIELIKSEKRLGQLIYEDDGVGIPTELTKRILDMFDVNEIYRWLTENVRLVAPADLRDKYIDNNHREDRDQTYTKDDYLKLAALIIAIKPILGIIGKYASIKRDTLGKNYVDIYCYRFISTHPISKSEPFIKLEKYIGRLSSASQLGGEDKSIRVIEKMMSEDDIRTWLVATTTIKKVMVASIIKDTANSHIVGGIYKFIGNRLNNDGNVSSKIRERKYNAMGGSDEDKLSVFEHYTTTYDLSYGVIVEINNDLKRYGYVLSRITNDDYDRDVYQDALEFLKPMYNRELSLAQPYILSYVLGDYIHPKAIFHIDLDIIVKLLAIAFTKLWKQGFKQLAILLTSLKVEKSDDDLILSSTSNISKVSQDTKDKIDMYYPYKKTQVSMKNSQEVSLIDVCISTLADEFYRHNWQKLAPAKYVNQVQGNHSDIKVILADYIISLNNK